MPDESTSTEELEAKIKSLEEHFKLFHNNIEDRLERVDRTLKALLTDNKAALEELRRKV